MLKKFSNKRRARGRKPESRKGRTLRHESLERREVLTAIHGVVFDDLKHHGTFDAQFDKGMAGIEITLSSVGGGGAVAPQAPPAPLRTTTTDANGAFNFENVDDGTYMVSQNVPAGYSPTTQVTQWVTVPSTAPIVAQPIPDSGNVWFGIASAGNIVAVEKQGNDLMLLGNSSNNHVEIHQTKNSGEFTVEGKEGTLLKVNGSLVPSTTVNNIVGDVGVMLGHGDDWFKFTGADSGGQSYVKGGLTIENDWGSNMNEIHDVKVMADLVVEKVPGVWGYSQLKIVDSIVEGNTVIYNGIPLSNQPHLTTVDFVQPDRDYDFEPSGGDSKTLIENSQLKGGEHEFGEHTLAADFANRHRLGFGALIILNGEGFDIVDIRDTKVGVDTMADTLIHNGDGGSRTTFTSENGLGNVFYGSLGVVNGTNPVGVQVYDTVIFNKTEVQKSTVIHNMDGDSMVVVQDNSVLGSSNTLETMEQGGGGFSMAGQGFNPDGKLIVLNDHGVDEFLMKDSAAPYGLMIDNAISMRSDDRTGGNMDGQSFAWDPVPSDTMHMYGSRTDIIDSEIGTNLKSDGGFYFRGDDKSDVINVTNSWIGGRNGVMIYTYDGDDEIWFYLKGHHVSMISIDTAEGMDHVRLEEVFVTNGTEIDMGSGGLDNLELLKASQFHGNNEFEGGDGRMDRYAKDIDVILENLSLDGFEDLDFGP